MYLLKFSRKFKPKFLRTHTGGTYDAHRDSDNMSAINAIPFFTDYLSTVKYVNKLCQLLREREMWESNRTTAQRNAGTSYMISDALLNNWLSQRLLGSDSRIVFIRDRVDSGIHHSRKIRIRSLLCMTRLSEIGNGRR